MTIFSRLPAPGAAAVWLTACCIGFGAAPPAGAVESVLTVAPAQRRAGSTVTRAPALLPDSTPAIAPGAPGSPPGLNSARSASAQAPAPGRRRIRRDPPGALPPALAHPHAKAGLARVYGGVRFDAWTYHIDGLRTGWNPNESELTPATVASSGFGLLTTLAVDGNVLAQPLLISNFELADGSVRDILVVATGHNSVYAYDAQDYTLLWQVQLGPTQATVDVGCDDIQPEYGISSTPVIVRTAANAATIYLVTANESQSFEFSHNLHALDLATGRDLLPPAILAPRTVLSDGSTMLLEARAQGSRAGLAWANGSIYVSIGSHCDIHADSTTGWMLRYTPKLKLRSAFATIQTPAPLELAGIWMSGFAPAIDSSGHLYAITGNGDVDRSGRNYGESVLRLPPQLGRVSDSFTPADYQYLNDNDLDFGAGGVMLLPAQPGQAGPPLAVAMGKEGVLYLLDQTHLGRMHAGDSGALQGLRVANSFSGVWGGPAYYAGPAGAFVFYQTDGDMLRSYRVDAGLPPSLSLAAVGTSPAGYGGSLPIVSSNGAIDGTAVVWLVRRLHTVQLEAYDAVKLGAPIYASSAGDWSASGDNAFVTPLQANGRVYVPADRTVSVFGLSP